MKIISTSKNKQNKTLVYNLHEHLILFSFWQIHYKIGVINKQFNNYTVFIFNSQVKA